MTHLEEIYALYPRKVGRRKALLEIDRALRRVIEGEAGVKMSAQEAVTKMKNTVSFYATTPAGQKGEMTPHPTTFFHQGRYLDDPKEWFCEKPAESNQLNRQRRNSELLSAAFGGDVVPENGCSLVPRGFDARDGRPVAKTLSLFPGQGD